MVTALIAIVRKLVRTLGSKRSQANHQGHRILIIVNYYCIQWQSCGIADHATRRVY